MMNINKKSNSISTYRGSYIVAIILFVIIFALCLVTYNFTGSTLFPLTLVIAVIAAIIGGFIVCYRCSAVNKIKNPDGFNPPRDMFYYLKRMGFFVIITFLMCMGISFIGTFLNGIVGGIIYNNVENLFLRGFMIKLPMFIVYLTLIYKTQIRYGFMDSERKIFNPNLKTLSMIISLILMIPNAVYDSMFFTSPLDTFILNIQTVLSPNIDRAVTEIDGYTYLNEDFNMILVIGALLLTFAIQAIVIQFAYKRGKQIFIKQHIREIDYDMDENI